MCRAVAARHQTRISIRLSLRVQYQSEKRSRSVIDVIAGAEMAFKATRGGASGFFWSISELSPE
jgi:hypothetical protein